VQVLVTSFGDNPGALAMYEHVPADLPAGAPLVVVLHGCTQQAADMENAGWDTLADADHFAVLYPQQSAANTPLECFDWFTPSDTANEATSIIEMIDTMVAANAVDTHHVYVTGISAGGAMTAALIALHPDRFAGASVMSGIAYGCATDVLSATTCQDGGVTNSAAQWASLVHAASPSFTGPWPDVQIWQGDQDTTVVPSNAASLVAQWTAVQGVSQTASETDTVGVATRTRYGEGSVEEYMVHGMGHAISIGNDPLGACPATAAMYFDDEMLCSTLRAAIYFGVVPSPDGSGSGSGSDGEGTPGASHSGGCAAGNGGGWLSAFAALALVAARRRGSPRL
jgi:poly(hydroxyalkanoate) depolymerase family esterase